MKKETDLPEEKKQELTGHPTTWVGKSYKHNGTGEIDKVLAVEKRHARYSVKIDGDNDYLRYLGIDSRHFRKTHAEL